VRRVPLAKPRPVPQPVGCTQQRQYISKTRHVSDT
jgi:hypothetical protein